MPIGVRGGSLIVRDGKLADGCGCCGCGGPDEILVQVSGAPVENVCYSSGPYIPPGFTSSVPWALKCTLRTSFDASGTYTLTKMPVDPILQGPSYPRYRCMYRYYTCTASENIIVSVDEWMTESSPSWHWVFNYTVQRFLGSYEYMAPYNSCGATGYLASYAISTNPTFSFGVPFTLTTGAVGFDGADCFTLPGCGDTEEFPGSCEIPGFSVSRCPPGDRNIPGCFCAQQHPSLNITITR